MQEIEMIATFIPGKLPKPYRFRVKIEDESLLAITIDKILFAEEDRKQKSIEYRCECIIQDRKKIVDIFFMKTSMKWFLKL